MNKIKKLRKKAGLTVKDLSEKTGISTGYISMLENEKENAQNPSKAIMEKISTALDKTVAEVFY